MNFQKNMVKPQLIWLIFLTLYANFRITLCFMKSNGCVALLNILNINLQKYHNVKQGVQGLQVLAFCVVNFKILNIQNQGSKESLGVKFIYVMYIYIYQIMF